MVKLKIDNTESNKLLIDYNIVQSNCTLNNDNNMIQNLIIININVNNQKVLFIKEKISQGNKKLSHFILSQSSNDSITDFKQNKWNKIDENMKVCWIFFKKWISYF